jgi:hypothetical protein
MTTRLKSILGCLALLACLSLSGYAQASLPPVSLLPASQSQIEAQQIVSTTLAWQRVGSPLRLYA